MNISIAVVDKNKEYLSRLVEGLSPFDLNISIYTSVEKLEETVHKKKFDIILFDPDICNRAIHFGDSTKLPICLYSDGCKNSMLYENVTQVSKYQRISNIYNEILRAYADQAGGAMGLDKSSQTSIISVFSPIGGVGKTMVALSIAGGIRDLGNEVLFLSLEQISSSTVVNPYVEEGITSLLSSKNDRNVNFELKVRGLAKRGIKDIYYIEGFERIVDYMDVEAEEIVELIEKIKRLGVYKAIVLDMGSCVDKIVLATLECSDQVVLVQSSEETGNKKMENLMTQPLVTDIEKKITMVSNKTVNGNFINKYNYKSVGIIHNYGNLPIGTIVQNVCVNSEVRVDQLLG